jgi:hypothetical protein
MINADRILLHNSDLELGMDLKLYFIQKNKLWYGLNRINYFKLKVYRFIFQVLSIWTTTKYTIYIKQAYLTIFHVNKL